METLCLLILLKLLSDYEEYKHQSNITVDIRDSRTSYGMQ